MQLSISGHHLDVTEAIKQHAEEKLSKIKQHYTFFAVKLGGAFMMRIYII
jgi:ribosomal subunit interface protein